MQALQESQAKARQAVSRSVQLQKTVQEKDKVSETQPVATSWSLSKNSPCTQYLWEQYTSVYSLSIPGLTWLPYTVAAIYSRRCISTSVLVAMVTMSCIP